MNYFRLCSKNKPKCLQNLLINGKCLNGKYKKCLNSLYCPLFSLKGVCWKIAFREVENFDWHCNTVILCQHALVVSSLKPASNLWADSPYYISRFTILHLLALRSENAFDFILWFCSNNGVCCVHWWQSSKWKVASNWQKSTYWWGKTI